MKRPDAQSDKPHVWSSNVKNGFFSGLRSLLLARFFDGSQDTFHAFLRTLGWWLFVPGVAVLLQTVSWFSESEERSWKNWFDTAFWSLNSAIGVIIGSGLMIARWSYHADLLAQHISKLEITGVELARVGEQLQTSSGAIDIIRTYADVMSVITSRSFVKPDHVKDVKLEAIRASRAWARNLEAWYDRAFPASRDGRTALSNELSKLWLSHAATYFTEEAFDVHRGEIVTNGRNYTLLRVSTLATMLASAAESEEVVVSCLVSPLNPKDWYNTPLARGRVWPRSYSDAGFPNLFHRCVRELLLSVNKSVEGTRVVRLLPLTLLQVSPSEGDTAADQMGWDLDTEHKLMEDLRGYSMIPIAVRPRDAEAGGLLARPAQSSALGNLIRYYQLINTPVFRERAPQTHFIPLYSSRWLELLNGRRSEADPAVIEAVSRIASIQPSDLVELGQELVGIAKNTDELNRLLADVDLRRIMSIEEYRPIVALVRETANKGDEPVPNFQEVLRGFHEMSLEHARADRRMKDPVHSLLLTWLRVREANRSGLTFQPLGEVFGKDLHEDPTHVKIATVSTRTRKTMPWVDDSHSGLMMYGTVSSTDLNDLKNIPLNAVSWKIALGAKLHYAHDAVTIQFIDGQDTLNKYGDGLVQTWEMAKSVGS